jgi:hypothetical protein
MTVETINNTFVELKWGKPIFFVLFSPTPVLVSLLNYSRTTEMKPFEQFKCNIQIN